MADKLRETGFRRVLVLGYGLLAYLVFLISVLYYIGFLANVGVPNGIDEGTGAPLAKAVPIDVGLISIFGLQHSVMARSWFKAHWTRVIPEPVERSTYVLFASVALLAVAWWWHPLPTVIWMIDGAAGWILWGGYGVGWVIVILSTFQISHTELFGIRNIYAYYRGCEPPSIPFQTPGFYQYVRHPLMTGLLLVFWITPSMTVGRLLLAVGFTSYILIGVRLEERMLVATFGDEYREYRRTVPMFLPRPGRSASSTSNHADDDSN